MRCVVAATLQNITHHIPDYLRQIPENVVDREFSPPRIGVFCSTSRVSVPDDPNDPFLAAIDPTDVRKFVRHLDGPRRPFGANPLAPHAEHEILNGTADRFVVFLFHGRHEIFVVCAVDVVVFFGVVFLRGHDTPPRCDAIPVGEPRELALFGIGRGPIGVEDGEFFDR
jgi:hypothetical protein